MGGNETEKAGKRHKKLKIKETIMILAVIAASGTATRADEISELVAAVAADTRAHTVATDMLPIMRLDTLPKYKPLPKGDIDSDILDEIYNAMAIKSVFDYVLSHTEDLQQTIYASYHHHEFMPVSPTLARKGFYRPVPGIITSRFGWRQQFNRLHHGVDLSLQTGDTVRAALTGTVEKIAYDHTGYGHYVVLSHSEGMQTLYAHLQYPLVGQGQSVLAGQPLGIGGNTGNSTGPHLHFEARLGGVAIDPMLIFDFYGRQTYFTDLSQPAPSQGPVYTHQSKSLAKESTYIVRYGDTLQSIARQAGISVMRLCQLNMLREEDVLTVGRMVKLK